MHIKQKKISGNNINSTSCNISSYESEVDEEEKDSGESPSKLSDALEIVQRLRLSSIT